MSREIIVWYPDTDGSVWGDEREEIVRCRDCKQFAVDQSMHEFREQYWCGWWHTDMVEPNSHCAWGERRNT